jgi:hypothetical protein
VSSRQVFAPPGLGEIPDNLFARFHHRREPKRMRRT